MVTVLRVLPKMLEKSKSPPVLFAGDWPYLFLGRDLRKAAYQELGLDYLAAKAGSCACAEELKGQIASANATHETVGNIPVSEKA